MADSLIAAVTTRLAQRAGAVLLGGAWFGEVPEESFTSYPYCELNWPTTKFEDTTESLFFAQPRFDVRCYSDTADGAEIAAWACFDALVWQLISFGANSQAVECRALDLTVRRAPGRDTTQGRVFEAALAIEYKVTRTYAS